MPNKTEQPKEVKELTDNEAEIRYRFSGIRYSLRGPDTWGPSDVIMEETSLYTFPRSSTEE